MNIQQITSTSADQRTRWNLTNILNPSHTEYVPHNGTTINQPLYDIVIPATPWVPNPQITIKIHNKQEYKEGTIHITYPETPEQNTENTDKSLKDTPQKKLADTNLSSNKQYLKSRKGSPSNHLS